MSVLDETNTMGKPAFIPDNSSIILTIDLIISAWARVRSREDIDGSSNEPVIAGALYLEFVEEKKIRRIDGPPRIANEVASRSSQKLLIHDGIIDFQLIYDWNESNYLVVECKRVSGSDKKLAKDYIKKGIMRFITGKYSPNHGLAAMAAFVIDDDVEGSCKLIGEWIINSKKQ